MHGRDDTATPLTLTLHDEAATLQLGARLATALQPGLVIYLHGDLGAGKTTLVRGLLRGSGFAGRVRSPTYTVVEPYAVSRLNLYHFDFYRFECAEEFLDGGFAEYFGTPALCLVEWPDKAAPYLPPADLHIHLAVLDEGRELRLFAATKEGQSCLNTMKSIPTDAAAATSCVLPPPH